MTPTIRRPRALLLALHLICAAALAAAAPAAAMQILDAADHAELAAEISARAVNRIALAGDRIAKVVRAPGEFAVEHDAASGDLYLRPAGPQPGTHPAEAGPEAAGPGPVTLFIGTEKGFTYRLTLTPRDRDSAQILIRNADTARPAAAAIPAAAGDPRVAALVRLVRAVARREVLAGYDIRAGGRPFAAGIRPGAGVRLVETWRGPRFAALVLEADTLPSARAEGPAGLAGTIESLTGMARLADGARLAAVWLAAPGTGPSGGRLGVAVVETAAAGEPR